MQAKLTVLNQSHWPLTDNTHLHSLLLTVLNYIGLNYKSVSYIPGRLFLKIEWGPSKVFKKMDVNFCFNPESAVEMADFLTCSCVWKFMVIKLMYMWYMYQWCYFNITLHMFMNCPWAHICTVHWNRCVEIINLMKGNKPLCCIRLYPIPCWIYRQCSCKS